VGETPEVKRKKIEETTNVPVWSPSPGAEGANKRKSESIWKHSAHHAKRRIGVGGAYIKAFGATLSTSLRWKKEGKIRKRKTLIFKSDFGM